MKRPNWMHCGNGDGETQHLPGGCWPDEVAALLAMRLGP